MAYPMGEAKPGPLPVDFDRRLKLEFHRSKITSDAGLADEVEHWSLTTLPEKLIKVGTKVVAHGRYVTFQLAEVAVPRDLVKKNPAADR